MNFEDANILVVDDEPALCKIFAGWLQRAGCRQVQTAYNGEEGLALVKATAVDLIVTDIRMPKMDGITMVRHLRKSSGPPPVILFVSGFGDVDHREMYSLGVEAFLPKPLSREEFVGRARRALMDKEHLLGTPLTDRPRQSLEIEKATLAQPSTPGDLAGHSHVGSIHLGRGGFAVCHAVSLTLGNLSFAIGLPAENLHLAGQGHVRWYDRAEQACGIELAFLHEPGRSWFIEQIRRSRYDTYIPFATPTPCPRGA